MIHLAPLGDPVQRKTRLAQIPVTGTSGEILSMCEGERELGWITVEREQDTLRLVALEVVLPSEDFPETMVADSLLRGAASYGAHFGLDWLEATLPTWREFLCSEGFSEQENGMRAPVSRFVTTSLPQHRER